MAALKALARDPKTTKNGALRRSGMLPVALTRRDHTTLSLQVPTEDLRSALKHADGHGRFELVLEGEKAMKVILKSQDYDFLHRKALSATLQEVTDQDVVRMDVAIIGLGIPEPVTLNTGSLVQPTDHVKLRAKMRDMPEHLEVDVSQMQIGDSLSAHELELPAGVELISSGDATIFTVQVAKVITAEDLTPQVEGEAAPAEEGEDEEKDKDSEETQQPPA